MAQPTLRLTFLTLLQGLPPSLTHNGQHHHCRLFVSTKSCAVCARVCLETDTLPNIPLLVLCTSDVPEKLLPHDVASLFTHTHPLHYPDEEARRAFWAHFVDDVAQPPPDVAKRKKRALAVLPKAPIQPALQKVTQVPTLSPYLRAPHTVMLTGLLQEDEQRKRVEDHYLRKLRMRFRECILSLLRERRFQPFYKPVVPTLTLALWPTLSFRRCMRIVV